MNFKNLSFTFRSILKHKAYSLLNIVGLAIGMASAMIIFIWAEHQLSMDKFHKNGKNIYMLHKQMKFSDGQSTVDQAITGPLGPVISVEVPEIKAAVRVPWNNRVLFRIGDKSFFERGIYADSTFFNIFSFPFIAGNGATALNNPNSVVISEKLATKYFGKENAIGKTILIGDNKEELYTVNGVFKELPRNCSFDFDYVLPYSKYYQYNKNWLHWGNCSMRTFILTQPNIDATVLSEKITGIWHKYDSWAKHSNVIAFVQTYEDAWLYGDFGGSINNPSGLILYVRLFIIVAIFIILLACMNYTNLATAIATKRAREVGVKKVFGSNRKQLVGQFITESLVLTLVSFSLSLLIVKLVLPSFNTMLEENLEIDFSNLKMIGAFIAVPLLTGAIAGIFPSIYLSSFRPIVALKSIMRPGKGKIQLRHALIVFQFVITIVFIIASLVVQKQISYIHNKKLGLDKDNVIFFGQNAQILGHKQAFRDELLKQPGVASVTYTDNNPLQVGNSTTGINWRGKDPSEEFLVSCMITDPNFARTLGVEIIDGRNLSSDHPSDTNCVMINQEMAKIMRMKNPVGEVIQYWGRTATVAGVVKNFHFNNFSTPIKQMMIICRPNDTWMVMVKIRGGQVKEAIHNVENVFRRYETNAPFEYRFLSDEFNDQYKTTTYLGWLAMIFTVLAIIISCLGLFGLALFTAEQRTKEIGVRKSNGATTWQVMQLLARDFAEWIIVSFIIASALAYFLMNGWLNNFVYKTDLSWWIFALTGIIALVIALITVCWQSWKAARRNPVESLRYE